MDRKKRRSHRSENEVEIDIEEQGDVIATIHVLKNKSQVKKRVVTRHSKENE